MSRQKGNYPLTVGTEKRHPCGWVEHITDTGIVYFTVGNEDPEMPRIPESLLDCSLYIYGSVEDAKLGESSGGSGFVVGIHTTIIQQPEPQRIFLHLYAVTNWHVILGCGAKPVLRLNTRSGETEILETDKRDWKQHPDGDDLAITSITLSTETHKFNFIAPKDFQPKERLWEISPGTDVVMIGRFITHDGKQRNLPSMRFGNIAMMPLEPIRHPGGFMQESFLVETRSLSGYSGSPVFAFPGILKFIGVDWGHIPTYEKVLEKDKRTPVSPRQWVKSNSGMCGVVPAWRLYDLLYDEEVKMKREQEDKELWDAQKASPMVLDSETKEAQPTQITADDYEIPVPTKDKFLGDLKKASRKKR